ncbi:hypothetical protein [Leptolyngbya sp. CCY15150]|uniref:hypothetical protein n=1 Tax=Leptolyngbya sp. CCY15150 TaxID=2767772 RepID=UPI00194ECD6A|nr:hypothetical protein [Leptolyngbya sp. CCY15150]
MSCSQDARLSAPSRCPFPGMLNNPLPTGRDHAEVARIIAVGIAHQQRSPAGF